MTMTVRTISGETQAASSFIKLRIGDLEVWRGEAARTLRQPKETGDGLLPAGIFKVLYVCNSEGYIAFE